MESPPSFTLTATVLDAPDARALAGFYAELLNWPVRTDEADWVTLAPPGGGAGLSFQTESRFVPPTWPAEGGAQQMMTHLDIEVTDLASAVGRATALGASVAGFQPQDDVRVMLDPVGHPFCLWIRDATV
ncbi:VOC family protein [Streptomyces sp. NPDC005574]|uniref:VOC family protein n=1 Tax=Streptomyces sp. NPDC005574 TaxID=3156891 RepID=UPI0033AC4B75